MEIREYQNWLAVWDRARNWDRVPPAHTLIHALEEMGEVARLVLQWEGYKRGPGVEDLKLAMSEELSDLLVFVFKLANQTGIDIEEALRAGQAKANLRHEDIEAARAEMSRFDDRQNRLISPPGEAS